MNQQIRNFVIISHVDHGKSTLADRFLEITGAVSEKKMRPQFLDMMDLEREKGITIKMQPVRMDYKGCCLNLIDTPGHVDFSYEVSRALAAVEGAVLLVDATKGIQAQTLANLEFAKNQGMVIIPVVNKIDLAQAMVEKTVEELANLLKIDKKDIIEISAKNGINIEKVLETVIEKIPEPEKDIEKPLRALIFDSKYDSFKGVIAYVRIVEGQIEDKEEFRLLASKTKGKIKELGYFIPELSLQKKLSAGEIGYIATGIKEPGKVRVGDTISKKEVEVLKGYKESKPMVFASLYPENPDDFDLLKEALAKLALSDPALIFEPESKEALGRGFRCGFLGTLHTEIVSERLDREFGLKLIISTPSVVYKTDKGFIYSPSEWPEMVKKSEEPWVLLEVIAPNKYIGSLSEILKILRGTYIETKFLGQERTILVYEVPLREIITNLYDKIKSVTSGFGSMNYRFMDYRESELIKMEILIAGEKHGAFSKIVPKDQAEHEARSLTKKIKESLPSLQFSVPIQAVVGAKIIARETKKSQRKDVTGALYGGDYSRKRKLLEKQKKGKKKLAAKGKVRIPPKVFLEVFKG